MIAVPRLPALLWSALLLCLAANGSAAELERVVERGNVTARVRIDRAEIGLADELTITVTVEGPAGLQVQTGRGLAPASHWGLSETPPAPAVTPLPDGRVRWEQTFRLIPDQPGKEVPLQLTPLRFRESADAERWQDVQWGEPLSVRVTTAVESLDLKEARDITPIEEVPPAFPWHRWVLAGGLTLLAAGGLAAGAWLLRRLLRRPPPPLPPDRWALRELERIEALGLPAAGQVERYHTQVSDVLRRYLELRFGMRARRQTTTEFLEAMRQSPDLSPPQQDQLRTFLLRCDLAKFARAAYSPDECHATAAVARDLIEQTARPTVPSPTPSQTA